jgi:hypothetical protein
VEDSSIKTSVLTYGGTTSVALSTRANEERLKGTYQVLNGIGTFQVIAVRGKNPLSQFVMLHDRSIIYRPTFEKWIGTTIRRID